MKNINFEITKADIKEYLTQHSDDREIQNREAMFVKYMREQRIITKESLEILMKKYNKDNVPFSDCGLYSCLSNSLKTLPSFSSYLRVQNLDIDGISHVLIPALGCYESKSQHIGTRITLTKLRTLGTLVLPVKMPLTLSSVLNSTIDDYQVADKINIVDIEIPNHRYKSCIDILMSSEDCEKELHEYESIYGIENVQKIKDYVRKVG